MTKSLDEIWRNCLLRVKDAVESRHFKTWIEPIKPIELYRDVLLLQVPDQYFYEYMPESDVILLSKTLRRLLGLDVKLKFLVKEDHPYSNELSKSEFVIPTS